MLITKDRVSALVFLALSVAYYVMAGEIELYPGDEDYPITAQTFPKVIGLIAGVVSFLIIVLPSRAAGEAIDWWAYDWLRPAGLCALMVLYGLTIKWPGFFLATAGFLVLGFLLLGERRIWVLAVASLPVAAGFEAILDGLLGIYIEDPFLSAIGLKG